MTDLKVTITDVREVNLCVRGARQWFTSHGLDFRVFMQEGYSIEVIEATGDALGKRVADHVRNKNGGSQ
jgi:hypothetical protein